jgi:beta-lactam-binding protein with PASTA domain
MGGKRKKGPPRGSVGSRKSSKRTTRRRVGESRSSKTRLVKGRKTDLGPTRDERRREARAVGIVLWLSVFIFLVLSASLLVYHAYAFWAGDKDDTTVPSVVDIRYEDAALSVEAAGLILRIRSEMFSDDTEKDIVIDQLPAAGARVKVGREVLVDVSRGSRTLTTPNVIGLDRNEATAQLDAIGVSTHYLPSRYSDVAPAGTIINQSPPPGDPIALGEVIELVSSAGPLNRAIQMPTLEGMYYEEALQIIQETRLRLRRVSYTYIANTDETVVSSQFPLPGTQVMQGSEVLLTVNAPTSFETLGSRQSSVTVDVPEAAGTVTVRITVQDRYETKEVYSAEHTGPTTVEQLINSYGRTTVRVYFGNQIIREETY